VFEVTKIFTFSDMKIRPKLMIIYSLIFFITISIGFGVVYFYVQNVIKENVEIELKNDADQMKRMILMASYASIENHLRTISESHKSIAEHYYALYQNGDLTEEEAKLEIRKLLSIQEIGTTGYIYILNSDGILKHHPKPELLEQNISEYEFIQKQISNREGYLEYMWKNPDDIKERPKALYMTYFEPWDWIISASSYREEFLELVDLADFEKQFLELKFGESGYPILVDNSGTFLIHPELKGRNLIKESHEQGEIVSKVLEMREGIVEYEWQNPNDESPRKKLMVFSELSDFDWIVVASSYKSEFYKPLKKISELFMSVFSISLISMLFITSYVGKMITYPIKILEFKVNEAATGDLSVRVDLHGSNEICELAKHFNTFIGSLETQKKQLQNEIEKKNIVANELVRLNEQLEELVEERTFELKEAQEKVVKSEKFLAMSKLINDIAHLMNTPLGISITSATYIDKEMKDLRIKYNEKLISRRDMDVFFDEIDETYEVLLKNLMKASNFVVAFKLLTSSEIRYVETQFNVKKQIEEAITMCIGKYNISFHSIRVHCPENIEIYNSAAHFNVILSNLIINANAYAFKEGVLGQIDISAQIIDDSLIIEFKDNGVGIPENDIEKIFDPLYTSKMVENKSSMGLGLSIIYNIIVFILNGNISVTSKRGIGTTFVIEIPLKNKI